MEESGYRPRLGWGVLGIIGRGGGIVIERESWSWSEAVLDFFDARSRIFAGVWEFAMWVEEMRGGQKLKSGLHEIRKNLDFEV